MNDTLFMDTSVVESSFMAKYSAYSPYRLIQQETGFGNPVGAGDAMARSLCRAMKPLASWECEMGNTPCGGIFNLEFSPEGSLLVAACEKKSIQIYDPLTHKRIHSVHDAHSDCVNCSKFLDGRMFATCSDDTTIALWDVRNLKMKVRSLLGHSNWVKNIEYSVKDKLLVTSGLDGSIFTWDINSYTESNLVYQRVYHASGLMRCRLSPDARQMVMCTTGGLLVIIHDLNLSTLAKDLHGFKPNLYRLMQMSQQVIPIAAKYDHLFDFKRTENRVEFVSDFPDGNDAEVVSALQVHPQGWCALSRNISHDNRSEWSCIHDIQPSEAVSEKSCRDTSSPPPPPRAPTPRRPVRRTRSLPCRRPRPMASVTPLGQESPSGSPSRSREEPELEPEAGPSAPRAAVSVIRPSGSLSRSREEPEPEPEAGPSAPRAAVSLANAPPARLAPNLSNNQNDVWEASITIKQQRMLQEMHSRGLDVGRHFNMQRIVGINTGITPPAVLRARHVTARLHASPGPSSAPDVTAASSSAAGASSSSSTSWYSTLPSTSGQTPRHESGERECPCDDPPQARRYIRQNRDRLLYYIEESNLGEGFIKELCFSADGRLVCSPFGRGARLLALNDNCAELSHCVQELNGPTEMVDVTNSLFNHQGVQGLVVSSSFSPRHHLLVTGCLEGKVIWYEPYSGPSVYEN